MHTARSTIAAAIAAALLVVAPASEAGDKATTTATGSIGPAGQHSAATIIDLLSEAREIRARQAEAEQCDESELLKARRLLTRVEMWIKAVGRNPAVMDVEVHNELGLVLQQLANCGQSEAQQQLLHGEAVNAFQAAFASATLEFAPQFAPVLAYNLSTSLQALDRPQESIAAMERAVALGRSYGVYDGLREDLEALEELRAARDDREPDYDAVAAEADELKPEVAKLQFDFPKRVEALVSVVQGQSRRSTASPESHRTTSHRMTWRVEREKDGYRVSMGTPADDLARMSPEEAARKGQTLTGRVDAAGTWLGADTASAKGLLRDEMDKALAAIPPTGTEKDRQAARDFATRFVDQLGGAMVDELVAEPWRLAVETWVDAELEHGSLYSLDNEVETADAKGSVGTSMRFRYNRRVPCEEGSKQLDCVELRMTIDVEPEDALREVDRLQGQLFEGIAPGDKLPKTKAAWIRTEALVVTDPKQLLPVRVKRERLTMIEYASPFVLMVQSDLDERQYSYQR